MNRALPRILAFVALLAVLGVTFSAMRDSSSWRSSKRGLRPAADDPYRSLATMLAPGHDTTTAAPRNPFAYVETRVAGPRRPVAPPKPVEVAPELPVLTAIITSDSDPKAVIRYGGKSYTVGPGDLFLDYSVVSVSADTVVLERAGQQIVLHLPRKGE